MPTAYEQAELDLPGMVAWWKLNDASGNFADSSGNALTMTASGSGTTYQQPSLLPGDPTNTSVKFNGSGYGTHADAALLDVDAFTLSCWCEPTQVSNAQAFLFGKLSAYSLSMLLPGVFTGGITGSTGPSSPPYTGVSNNPYLVGMTFDHVAMLLYVNGLLLGSAPRTAATPNSANALEIARDVGNNWIGWLQHMVLRSAPLALADFQNLYVIGNRTVQELAGLNALAYPFSRQIVAANPSRARVTLWNDSDRPVYLSLGGTAVVGAGPRLLPHGADGGRTFEWPGAISAIHGGGFGGKLVTIQEE